MKLAFSNVEDFVTKRTHSLDALAKAQQNLEEGLQECTTFSEDDLGKHITREQENRYLLLKELVEDNASFTIGKERSLRFTTQIAPRLQLDSGMDASKPYVIEMNGNDTDITRELEFILSLWDLLPNPKHGVKRAYLIGEDISKHGFNAGEGHYSPFNTKAIIEAEGFANLQSVSPQSGPRGIYDNRIYQTFLSDNGFEPVYGFISRYPQQFFQGIITHGDGEAYIGQTRLRHKNWRVQDYEFRLEFNVDAKQAIAIAQEADRLELGHVAALVV